MGNKLYKAQINITWFLEAKGDMDAENKVINEFRLENTPNCCTWDMDIEELVSVDSLKSDTTLVTLNKAAEIIEETDSPRILILVLELVRNQVCNLDEEIYLSAEIQQEIRKKLGKEYN
jgi:hypothetical protein